MGVPVMELFLVVSPTKTQRHYDKGILNARRTMKAFGKGSTLTPIKVTLTKDGVIEALNKVPFKAREPATTGGRQVPMLQEAAVIPEAAWAALPEAVRPLSPLYTPDPEDRARLAGRPREYVYGWNQVKYNKAMR